MHDPLPTEALRWRCDPSTLPFETTADVADELGVVGQPGAVEALRFGIECDAPGQNVYVRGITGTGRMTLIAQILDELRPSCSDAPDRCFVRNFEDPGRPRLLTVPAGSAPRLRRLVHELAEFVSERLGQVLESDGLRARREALEKRAATQLEGVTGPFQTEVDEAGLGLVSLQVGPVSRPTVFPLADGKPVPPDEFEKLHEEGKVDDESWQAWETKREDLQRRLGEVTRSVEKLRRTNMQALRELHESEVRAALSSLASPIREAFAGTDVAAFLEEVIDDVVDRLGEETASDDPTLRYAVNVVRTRRDDGCPVVIETNPSVVNLMGAVERTWTRQGGVTADHMGIRAGAVLRADGGYLILDARDVLLEPGAWQALVRTLRADRLEIVPHDTINPFGAPMIKPDAIPVKLRVILVGDGRTYYMLDGVEPDFSSLFKVLADFDSSMPREGAATAYAGVLSRVARAEKLPPFDKVAVAALVDHGARIAASPDKVTARLGRVVDIAREAAFIAGKAGADVVTGDHIVQTVRRTKERASLPSRRFQEMIRRGTIRVQTSGVAIGQINGLAVLTAGPITYGFPARITASISPGNAGIVDIEGRAALSGSIHTKGFHILGGCLRTLLHPEHPLMFSASLAFEQSYGGIDGDSASGAEICCLLSALTEVPIKQSFAMTGAIDQHGHVQAIGGVNEKVEGFYDVCASSEGGLTGDQGVLIPESNAGDLMLRHDIVEACREGDFAVYAVGTVLQALEVLTGKVAGVRPEDGDYPENSLLHLAVARADAYWRTTNLQPGAGPTI